MGGSDGEFVIWIVLMGFLMISIQAQDEELYRTETRLKDYLLTDYDASVPPRASGNDSVSVMVMVSLRNMEGLDISSETLTTHIWLLNLWEDRRLCWSPSEFNGLTSIAIPTEKIWRPDLIPANYIGEKFQHLMDHQAMIKAKETNDGTQKCMVFLAPMIRLQTRCIVNLRNFPFDQQQCSVAFNSITYPNNKMELKSIAHPALPDSIPFVDTTQYTPNKVWDLVDSAANVTRESYSERVTFDRLVVNLTFKRHSNLIMHLYVGPAVCIGLTMPAAFLLPATSSYKLVLGVGLLIAQTVMINMMGQALPPSHLSVPTISMYLLANVILLCLSLGSSTVIIYCWNRSRDAGGAGVPAVLDKVFLGVFGKLLRVKRDDYIEGDVEMQQNTTETADNVVMVKRYTALVAPAEWRQLSVVLDRLLFVVFMLLSIVTMASMIRYA